MPSIFNTNGFGKFGEQNTEYCWHVRHCLYVTIIMILTNLCTFLDLKFKQTSAVMCCYIFRHKTTPMCICHQAVPVSQLYSNLKGAKTRWESLDNNMALLWQKVLAVLHQVIINGLTALKLRSVPASMFNLKYRNIGTDTEMQPNSTFCFNIFLIQKFTSANKTPIAIFIKIIQ